MTLAGYNLQDNVYIYSNNKCMCVFLISPVPITEPLTSELIDTPVFYNLAPRPIKYRVSVPIPSLHCVWQLESVERCVYLIGSPFFTSSCTRTCHKDRQEMCSGTSSCVLSFTLSLTEIRTAESLRQQASLCVCPGHYILLKLLWVTGYIWKAGEYKYYDTFM